jgi:hypothetical protein
MATKKRCASCWAGEIDNDDVVGYFTGYYAAECRPFRGYLCDDHLTMICEDNVAAGYGALKGNYSRNTGK